MSNASLFSRYARTEEAMIRAAMPRVSAANTEPLAAKPTRRIWSAGSIVVKTNLTLAEVAHA
jgi:hypothetical protein